VPGDIADRSRQGENDMVVFHGQEVGLAGLEPAPGRTGLTLRTMPVAAVVGDPGLHTGRTLQQMTAERRVARVSGKPRAVHAIVSLDHPLARAYDTASRRAS